MYGWVIMRKVVSIVCHLFIFNGSNCAFHPFTTISSRTGGGSHITTILLNYSMFSCQWLTNTDPPPSAWDSVMIKENVQGSYNTDSTCSIEHWSSSLCLGLCYDQGSCTSKLWYRLHLALLHVLLSMTDEHWSSSLWLGLCYDQGNCTRKLWYWLHLALLSYRQTKYDTYWWL